MAVTKIRQKQIESINASNVSSAIEEGVISASRLVAGAGEAGITDQELSFLKGVESSVQTQLNERLKKDLLKNKSQMTDWDDDSVAVTAKAISVMVSKKIGEAQISGVMVYKGAWSGLSDESGTIEPGDIKAGATFCYDEGETPYGHVVEAGDMIIAAVDSPKMAKTADWNVVQTNISGAVTSVTTASADNMLVVFSGSKGKVIQSTTLSGLVKLDNGIVKVAEAADLPKHEHPTDVKVNGSKIGSFTDVLNLVADGIIDISWDTTKSALVLSVNYEIANGTPQDGKYVNGMKVNGDGKLELSYVSVPRLVTGMKFNEDADGVRTDFTVADGYASCSETVILNGQVLTRGTDYTVNESGQVCFSTENAPKTGEILRVNYVKE